MTQTTRIIKLSNTGLVASLVDFSPVHYERRGDWSILSSVADVGRRTLVAPFNIGMVVGTQTMSVMQRDLDLNDATSWDSISPDYTAPANRAGKDFYIYGVGDQELLLSANSTMPDGFTETNSRKLGGFHCLCADVGTISGHTLTGFKAGDILPASIWDLNHRPASGPEGMVWSEAAQLWVDIYPVSGTGTNTASIFNAAPRVSRTWLDFIDDLGAVGKTLLGDTEFQLIAAGSNEETNIAGSANPGTAGGHIDTSGRRMISDIGCEDCCGLIWQWLDEQSFRILSMPDTGDPSYSYYDLPGAKGSMYHQGGQGDVKLRAGGLWAGGSDCGSRARYAYGARWYASSNLGARGCARSRVS